MSGERQRWEEDLKVLQRAIECSPNGGAQQAVYGLMATVVGAMLGDPVYSHNYREMINDAKRQMSGIKVFDGN